MDSDIITIPALIAQSMKKNVSQVYINNSVLRAIPLNSRIDNRVVHEH